MKTILIALMALLIVATGCGEKSSDPQVDSEVTTDSRPEPVLARARVDNFSYPESVTMTGLVDQSEDEMIVEVTAIWAINEFPEDYDEYQSVWIESPHQAYATGYVIDDVRYYTAQRKIVFVFLVPTDGCDFESTYNYTGSGYGGTAWIADGANSGNYFGATDLITAAP